VFFLGQIVSNSGTWLQNVAQGVLVLDLTKSSFMVGVTNAAMFLPVLVLALPGGSLADRFDRRRLLLGTQVLAMAATGTLAGLAFAHSATVAAVLVIAVLIGIQYAVSIPTMGALMPELVEREQLGHAIGLNGVTYNLSRVVGPILATAAIAAFGFGWAFALNSLSFVALIVALLLLRLDRVPRPPAQRGSMREVVRYAWRRPRIRLILLAVAAVAFASDPVVTLAPTFARHVFGRSGADAGLIVAAFGTGAILAALVFSRLLRGSSATRLRSVRIGMAGFVGGLAAFAFAPSFWPALVALLVGGVGYLVTSTTWTTALVEEVPNEIRGRIMALWTLSFLGMRPLAALVDGSVADLVSPRVAVLVVLVPLALVGVFGVRMLRRDPPPEVSG
jgi:MFS family permease